MTLEKIKKDCEIAINNNKSEKRLFEKYEKLSPYSREKKITARAYCAVVGAGSVFRIRVKHGLSKYLEEHNLPPENLDDMSSEDMMELILKLENDKKIED